VPKNIFEFPPNYAKAPPQLHMTFAFRDLSRDVLCSARWGSGMVARAARVWAGTFSASSSLVFLLMAVAIGRAQTPPPPAAPNPPPLQAGQPKPVTGFVSSYEILRTVRAAGFDPLVQPLREGSIYVLRATDYRGILMRVVLDARTGVIRDVTRIVSATPGPYGMMEPYGPPAYASAPYGPYAAPDEPEPVTPQLDLGDDAIGPPPPRPAASPTVTRPPTSTHSSVPPLPRPRPAALASQKTEKTGKVAVPAAQLHPPNSAPQTGASANAAGVNSTAAPATSATPSKLPPLPPFND
jgi:hypothetical protein